MRSKRVGVTGLAAVECVTFLFFCAPSRARAPGACGDTYIHTYIHNVLRGGADARLSSRRGVVVKVRGPSPVSA